MSINLYNFEDPGNEEKEKYHSLISKIKSPEEAIMFASNITSNVGPWIVDEMKEFSEEYSKLDENWTNVCNQTSQSKKSILIVKKVAFSKDFNYSIIRAICEILTRCGWCVRGEEFIRCNGGCHRAIFRLHKEKCNECEGGTLEIE
jgi:hypothetical protein